MKPSHGVEYPKLRIVLPLIAGMAMLASSIAPAGASSGSGGISTGDDGGTEEAPAHSAKYDAERTADLFCEVCNALDGVWRRAEVRAQALWSGEPETPAPEES